MARPIEILARATSAGAISDLRARVHVSRTRGIIAAGAVVIALSLVSGILTRPPSGEEAVDVLGRGTGAVPQGTAGATTDAAAPQSASAARTEAAAAASPVAVTTIEGTQVSAQRRPLVLLNPGTVRQGSTLGLAGDGFDPASTIDLVLKVGDADPGRVLTFVQADRGGAFGNVNISVPDGLANGTFVIEARQRKSPKVARAVGAFAGAAPTVQLGTLVGKPGDEIAFAAQGFAPDEDVSVYWNSVGGTPLATFRAAANGAVAQGTIRLPFGAVGRNAFVFVGGTSRSPATYNMLLLSIFPSVQLSTYATRADAVMRFTGRDFGRDERVAVYLNSPDGEPIMTVQANADGEFNETGGFRLPFALTGKQTLIFVGELSRAPATASFDVIAYTPNVQPSTYAGRAGTTVTFYATDFARSEIVDVFLGRTPQSPGRLVSCFRADEQGRAAAQGSYTLRGQTASSMVFSFVGRKSNAAATTSVDLSASDVPVQLPPEPVFVCGLNDP